MIPPDRAAVEPAYSIGWWFNGFIAPVVALGHSVFDVWLSVPQG